LRITATYWDDVPVILSHIPNLRDLVWRSSTPIFRAPAPDSVILHHLKSLDCPPKCLKSLIVPSLNRLVVPLHAEDDGTHLIKFLCRPLKQLISLFIQGNLASKARIEDALEAYPLLEHFHVPLSADNKLLSRLFPNLPDAKTDPVSGAMGNLLPSLRHLTITRFDSSPLHIPFLELLNRMEPRFRLKDRLGTGTISSFSINDRYRTEIMPEIGERVWRLRSQGIEIRFTSASGVIL
jgi:hypothetical protein